QPFSYPPNAPKIVASSVCDARCFHNVELPLRNADCASSQAGKNAWKLGSLLEGAGTCVLLKLESADMSRMINIAFFIETPLVMIFDIGGSHLIRYGRNYPV